MAPMTADDRRRALTIVGKDDADLSERLRVTLDDFERQAAVASAVAAQAQLAELGTRAMALLERFLKVEERREDRWREMLGPKGLIAMVVGAVTTLATAWMAAGSPVAPH